MSDPKTEELKPCPFCGGKARVHEFAVRGKWIVFCDHATCPAYMTNLIRNSRETAIESWNTREGEKSARAEGFEAAKDAACNWLHAEAAECREQGSVSRSGVRISAAAALRSLKPDAPGGGMA